MSHDEPFSCPICDKKFEEAKELDIIYRKQNNYCSSIIKKAVREIRGEKITNDSTTKQTYKAIKDIMYPEFVTKNSVKIEASPVKQVKETK